MKSLIFTNADVFVYNKNRWFYNATSARIFFVTPEKQNKNHPKGIFAESIFTESQLSIPKASFEASGPRGIFLFHFCQPGMQFHTISLPPSSRQPWTINISTSQSIFIIKHMPNAVCGCEDTGLLFIHLIYLYFFPEGETLVSIHLC